MNCIDVRTLGRFRVRPTSDHEKGCHIDPWNLEIICRAGTIYPHGGTKLQAFCNRPQFRNRLKALPCVTVWQDGDSETTVIFDAKDFPEVAAILRPRQKRSAETAQNLRCGPKKGVPDDLNGGSNDSGGGR